MTLTEARKLLRSELLAVAGTVVPDQEPVVTHDVGPAGPELLVAERSEESVWTVAVETGDPASPDPVATIGFAAETLQSRGWTVETAPVDNGHHHVAAHRDGYALSVDATTTDWRITFTGKTPHPEQL